MTNALPTQRAQLTATPERSGTLTISVPRGIVDPVAAANLISQLASPPVTFGESGTTPSKLSFTLRGRAGDLVEALDRFSAMLTLPGTMSLRVHCATSQAMTIDRELRREAKRSSLAVTIRDVREGDGSCMDIAISGELDRVVSFARAVQPWLQTVADKTEAAQREGRRVHSFAFTLGVALPTHLDDNRMPATDASALV